MKHGLARPRGLLPVAAVLHALALAACTAREGDPADRIARTQFPGQVSAGGGTSGEVEARRRGGGPNAPGPSGTPGIPHGAEGNTGGTAMGGTSPAGSQIGGTGGGPQPAAQGGSAPLRAGAASAPASPVSGPPVAASAAPATDQQAQAEQERQQLEQAMERIAARWRARPGPEAAPADAPPPAPATAPLRSEKLGTAPVSEDVKDASLKRSPRPMP